MEEYERVYCYESLYQAHKLARRGKQNTREVILYEMRLSEHIKRLSDHLKGHTVSRDTVNSVSMIPKKERSRHFVMGTGSSSTVYVTTFWDHTWKSI